MTAPGLWEDLAGSERTVLRALVEARRPLNNWATSGRVAFARTTVQQATAKLHRRGLLKRRRSIGPYRPYEYSPTPAGTNLVVANPLG